jgi:hypothetical protein
VITEKLYAKWERKSFFFLQFINIGENTNIFLIGKQPKGYMFLLILLSSFGQGLVYVAVSGLNCTALSDRMFD